MKAYIFTAVLTCLLSLLIIALFNGWADPYSALGSNSSPIPREYKFKTVDGVRITKAADIYHLKPNMILLGTSRVLCGIDAHQVKQLLDVDCYNLGITDSNFEELYAYFEHALYYQPQLKHVVIGVDLFSFNQNHPGGMKQSDRKKLGKPRWLLNQAGSLLLSAHTAVQSFFTLYRLIQEKVMGWPSQDPRFIDIRGNIPEPLTESWVMKKGSILFEEQILSGLIQSPNHYQNFQLLPKALTLFSKMVATCKERNITLKVFISPCGARYWQALHLKGLWEELERLKTALVKSVDIWDFSGITSLTVEDESRFLHFFESGHYRPCTGEKIIRILYGLDTPLFGTYLTQENLQPHLTQLL